MKYSGAAFEVILSEKAERQLKKLDKSIQRRAIAVLERIRLRPEAHLQKLVDDPGFKLRIGDYRAIVDVDKQQKRIAVLKIGHRKNIYKNL
ncbi:MAG: type II toxin-antitoxin system RelE/ParE family toxin [Candidatus Micrarchaeota archaeon]